MLARVLRVVDRGIGAIVAAAAALVLPVSLLLFLQWPLRDFALGYSREANDLAQALFAVYVSVAITAATRAHTHLAADAFAQSHAPKLRRTLTRGAALAVLGPWAAFLLWTSWPSVAQSVRQLEAFPETFSPGYFVVKLALPVLALLVLAQALVDLLRRPDALQR